MSNSLSRKRGGGSGSGSTPATPSATGVVRPSDGLSVAADGTLTVKAGAGLKLDASKNIVIDQAAVMMQHEESKAYSAGDVVHWRGRAVRANANIPVNTPFAWGVTGANWSPVLPDGFVWRGVYANATAYNTNDVFVSSAFGVVILVMCSANFTSASSSLATDMQTGGAAAGFVTTYPTDNIRSDHPFYLMAGATTTQAGRRGLVPAPAIVDSVGFLRGDATWQRLQNGATIGRRRNLAQSIPNAADTLVQWDTVDDATEFDSARSGLTITTGNTRFVNGTSAQQVYLVSYQVTFANTSNANNRVAHIRWQGDAANRLGVVARAASSTIDEILQATAIVRLPANGYFELVVFQDSGQSLDIGSVGVAGMASGFSTRISATRITPT